MQCCRMTGTELVSIATTNNSKILMMFNDREVYYNLQKVFY